MEPQKAYQEEKRLQVLHQYHILDTLPEPCFDTIVLQASRHCRVPIALFTLIDESRQWFKANVGLDIEETDRAVSFCAHAVASDAPLVVEDTLKDYRFAANPLVVGHPKIRFYAGVPVRAASNEPLGTLCVIDHFPRSFPWKDFLLLQELAKQIEAQLEIRRGKDAHRQS
jgi:GAF domain-containing protein